MLYSEFEKRYEAQLLIGKVIDTIVNLELKESVTKLSDAAEKISPSKFLDDAHWLIDPMPVEKAWALYGPKSGKP